MDFVETVSEALDRHRMLRSGDRVLAGVSGGPDSTALLLALTALRLKRRFSLQLLHLSHGLRPGAGPREAAFVRRLGKLYGVPVTVRRLTIRKRGGESLEEAARQARFEALEAAARRLGCGVIALGHTLDDQAETVLMRLLRGTGPEGLAGIPPVRPTGRSGRLKPLRVIRPLLGIPRTEVERFLRAHGVRPLRDPSNRSSRFFRNRLRRQVFPLLEAAAGRDLKRHLADLAELTREEGELLDREAAAAYRQAAKSGPGRVDFKGEVMATLPRALRIRLFRRAVERLAGSVAGWEQAHWAALDRMGQGAGPARTDFPGGLTARSLPGRSHRWRLFVNRHE